MERARPSDQRWLLGPLPDLALGCGLAYAAVFVLLGLAGPELRTWIPHGLAPLVLLVSGTPHYGATLLRVYERRADRRAYAFFAVWVTLAVAALFVAGLRSAWVGSLLLTVMLTWSPWHYTGQNYGIALTFLRRRGVPIGPGTKRVIYASFLLSFVLTFLAVHGEAPSGEYAPVSYGSSVYRFLPLGIPLSVRAAGLIGVGAAYGVSLLAAAVLLLRVARLRDLAPAVAIAATQALWFSVPVLARHLGVLQGIEPLATQQAAYAFLWVAVGHSVQYLWICAYYARRADPGVGTATYLGKTLLAGAALWTLPALVFAPGLLGGIPFDAGLSVLIAAVVNIHHFILDGAIWKLRDGRVARILIRSAETPDPARTPGPIPRPRLRLAPLVWAAGALCVAVTVVGTVEEEFGVRRALQRGDLARVEAASRRLDWIGRASPTARTHAGLLRAGTGDVEGALRAVQEGLELFPTAQGWRALGFLQVRAGRPERAIQPYQEALRLRPGWPEVANDLAWIRATHPDFFVRDPARALELAHKAVAASHPQQAGVLDTLAAAYAAAGRFGAAEQTARRARELALNDGATQLAEAIDARVQLYASGKPFVEERATKREPGDARLRWQVEDEYGHAVDGARRD